MPRNKIAVIDTKDGKPTKLVEVGKTPHPGRGANFIDPKFGPAIMGDWPPGDDSITLIGTDPRKHPTPLGPLSAHRRVWVAARCSWKTHPKSKNLARLIRRSIPSQVLVNQLPSGISTTRQGNELIPIGGMVRHQRWPKRVVQPEYNKAGDEVWFSVWNEGSGISNCCG